MAFCDYKLYNIKKENIHFALLLQESRGHFMQKEKKKSFSVSMRATFMICMLVPMSLLAIFLGVAIVSLSSTKLDSATNNSLLSVASEIGTSFDYIIDLSEQSLADFASAPVVKEYLKNRNDANLAAKAQKYTVDYFNNLFYNFYIGSHYFGIRMLMA